MRIIGLLGGIASGKSLVADLLRQRGAVVLDGDRAGHEVLRLPEVVAAARERWGEAVFDAQGGIDRKKVAARVFGQGSGAAAELEYLEQLTHPRIGERLRQQAAEAAHQGAPLLVLDAPLMLKGGWADLCQDIVYVDARPEVRQARALARGWTADEFALREAAQETLEEKRRRSTHVIDNSGTREQTEAQVLLLWPQLVGAS